MKCRKCHQGLVVPADQLVGKSKVAVKCSNAECGNIVLVSPKAVTNKNRKAKAKRRKKIEQQNLQAAGADY